MSIFDPHGYYISRKYNTAKGQILQKKPIDPPYVYDIAFNISKLQSLGYQVYKPLDNSIDPSILRSYFLTYPLTNSERLSSTQLQVNLTYENIISQFRQNYDFSFLNQYDINSIKSIEFRLYSDCFSCYYSDSTTSDNPELQLTTSTLDNVSLSGYGITYSGYYHTYYIQNYNENQFIPSGYQLSYANKSVKSQFLAGGVNVYQSISDINNFISAITGQTTFPGDYINLLYTDSTLTSTTFMGLYAFPIRMDILIHFKV